MKKKKRRKTKKTNYKKLNKIIITIFIITIIPLIGILIYNLLPKTKTNTYNVYEDNGLDIYNDDTVMLYTNLEASNIYLYNIKELLVNYRNKEITFKEYLQKYQNVDDLFKVLNDYLTVKGTLKDGGTVIYRTKVDNKLFKDSVSVIKCNTIDGNRDIYIGKNMNSVTAFKHGACGKNFFEDKEFSRTYKIVNFYMDEESDKKLHLKLINNDEEIEVEYNELDEEKLITIMNTLEANKNLNLILKINMANSLKKIQLIFLKIAQLIVLRK